MPTPVLHGWIIAASLCAIIGAEAARADVLSAVQVLREGGCGGLVPAAKPLRHNALLDRIAQQWAAGASLSEAAERSGYRILSPTGLHARGPDASMLELLRRSECRAVTNPILREMGVYRRGPDFWLVLASDYLAPTVTRSAPLPQRTAPAAPAAMPSRSADSPTPLPASRALQLVNQVRARGTRCGARAFAPAPPMTLSGSLAGVALGHAADMAQYNYFEHQDLSGQSPADRVRAIGYKEKLVGENIAYGPESVEEVVQGWLDSPEHCENIMDPRFAEMGIASAAGRSGPRRGLYWVQLLAAPRA
jgi:uncharacterized protein YkwD